MQINPLAQPSEVSGKSDTRVDGASKIERIEPNRSLPSQAGQRDQSARVAELRAALKQHDITLNFSHDERTNKTVVRLINDKTGEAIRQMPTEVSLELAALIQGQIINEQI
jgi:uncharacterized FlaG/YvyC family protein